MTFGILEDRYLQDVPGTALLSDLGVVQGHQVVIKAALNLKRGVGKDAHVVLVPQPSDDPNDPLNWPRWKREACFWTLAFTATLDGALGSMVGPGYVLLSHQFGVSVDKVAASFGSILLGLACFMLFQNALATKFGHRIVYLGSVSLMFVTCIWCAVSPNMASITASRVFQGFGMSALQCLVASTIEQISFVHERGSRLVILGFTMMSGVSLGPLVYSYVIEKFSWQMGFWFITIPMGIGILLIILFVPETTYTRENQETKSTTNDSEEGNLENNSPLPVRKPKSYVSQLRIWNGTYSQASILRIFLRSFPFLLSPVTWFMFFAFGMQTVWFSLVPLCASTIFTIEYNFTPTQIGLTNLGGLVGIVLAISIAPLTDRGIVWLAKRNQGVYEPEFRIFFVGTMLLGVFGYAGWAVGTRHGMHWIGAVACITMANFSVLVSGAAAVTYLLDTHGRNALHVLALTNFMKNLVLYGFSCFANGMVVHIGVEVSLLILAACQAICWLSSIPMYRYGKRVRAFISRHPSLALEQGI